MEIRDTGGMGNLARSIGERALCTPLYPAPPWGRGLLAVDLWQIEPGGATSLMLSGEEQVLFVMSGSGRLSGPADGSPTAGVRQGSVLYIAPHEAFTLRNTGAEVLRLLVSAPMLVWSDRALGHDSAAPRGEWAHEREAGRSPESDAAGARGHASSPALPGATPPPPDTQHPAPEVSGLMRRASELAGQPRPERRRPPEPPPPSDATAEAEPQQEEEETPSNLMELAVVFEGRVRGPEGRQGPGHGKYSVQAPGRNPVIKSVEFGDGYTKELADYETLIECLQYIAQRLNVTGRDTQHAQLAISTSNDIVVQQLLDNSRLKDPALRRRHDEAMSLLGQFAEWQIELHSPQESAEALRF